MKKAGSGARSLRVLIVTLLLLAASFAWLLKLSFTPPSLADELSLDQVYNLASRGQIRFATLLDEDALVIGQLCLTPTDDVTTAFSQQITEPSQLRRDAPLQRKPCPTPLRPFQASYPRSDVSTQQLIERMTAGASKVQIDKQTGTAIIKLLLTFMYPLLILANLFGIIFLARGGDSSMTDIAGFGRIGKKGKKGKEGKKTDGKAGPSTGVTFENVAGADEAVAELREVTDYLIDPKKYQAYGASAPKGVLLFGPPGCGKTLMARAVAGEAGVPFFSVSGAEFIESLVGVGAARVRDLFSQVREQAPAIVFIDEIDAVGRKRSGEGSTGGEREQTVNQLLVELDGFEVSAGIVLMGATNRPDILDPALLRPGRFDRHVTLESPDIHGRQAILELHAKGKPIAEDVDFEYLARRTPGFTGADLANVINEGALLAIRQETEMVDAKHLAEAVQRVIHGPQRRGKLMTGEERLRLAFHESGHALVAAAVGQAEGVQRISIVARGRGLGASAISAESERVLLTVSELKASMAVAMAGISAEKLMFSEASTTGQDDLAKANALAREMVGIQGMGPELGPLKVLSTEGGYLGSDATLVEAVSGQSLATFDLEVTALMREAEQTALGLLNSNRADLEAMAKILEEEETLEGSALQAILSKVNPSVMGPFENGQPVAKPRAVRP